MCKLPVDHRTQPAAVDNEVAEAEVAVHDRHTGSFGTVRNQPVTHQFEGWVRLAEAIEYVGVERDLIGIDKTVNRRRIKLVNPRERSATVSGEPCSGTRELVIALDLSGNRFTVDCFHDHERAAIRKPPRHVNFRYRHTTGMRCTDHRCFDEHVSDIACALQLRHSGRPVRRKPPRLA